MKQMKAFAAELVLIANMFTDKDLEHINGIDWKNEELIIAAISNEIEDKDKRGQFDETARVRAFEMFAKNRGLESILKLEDLGIGTEYTKFRDMMIDVAKESFERDGECIAVMSLLLDLCGKRTNIIIDARPFMETDDTKEHLSMLVRGLCMTGNIYATVFISEVWMLKEMTKNESSELLNKDGTYKKGAIRPSEHPDKVEALMIMAERVGKQDQTMFEIDRSEKKPKLVLKMDSRSEDAEMHLSNTGGRFAGFLKEDPKKLKPQTNE